MRDLPWPLRWYLWGVYLACLALVAIQVGTIVTGVPSWHGAPVLLLDAALFAALAYLGERAPIQVSRTVDLSLATPIHIAVILLLPAPLPVFVAFAAVLVTQARRTDAELYKRAFNIAHSTLAVGLSLFAFSFVAVPTTVLRPGHVAGALPFLVGLIALYYALDVGMMVALFSLLERRTPWLVWRRTYRRTLVPELAAAAVGVLAAVAWDYDHVLLVLIALPVVALRVAFRAIAEAEERAAALRRRSAQLEAVLAAGQHVRLQQDAADLLRPVVEAARAVVRATSAAAYLRDDADSSVLVLAVTSPPDDAADPPTLPLSSVTTPQQERCILLVPLELEDAGVVGLLRLAGIPDDVRPADRDALAILATQAAIALQNGRLYREAQEARALAEAAVRVRDDFLVAASHDLRTPLTTIVGRSDVLHMRLTAGKAITEDWLRTQIDALREAAGRMFGTVDEITDVAQLQMGRRLDLHLSSVDVSAMVRATAALMAEANARWSATQVHVDAGAPVEVHGDRARLERVVQNIIGNAIKYSPHGTPVHVEVTAADNWAYITVKDQGVGIPADEVPHIFSHFYRASTSTGIKGTGIGLAGARTIVEMHGGWISVDSAVGQGTTVVVALPCLPPQAEAVPE